MGEKKRSGRLFLARFLTPIGWLAVAGALAVARAPLSAAENDPPSLRWTFEDGPGGELAGDASVQPIGPTAAHYEGLPETNRALQLDGSGDFLRVRDNHAFGSLKFRQGDALSIEAWVRTGAVASGQNIYVVGKGRTFRDGRKENQNYALRLRGAGGEARVSFLFRSRPEDEAASAYHRWTSDRGFVPDGTWHHVAVSYTFGQPESVVAYVDGRPTQGEWDMGGATKRAPVVDDDELWIGSALGGSAGNSFRGAIDDVVIHRRVVPAASMAERRKPILRPPQPPATGLPPDRVLVTLRENVGDNASWPVELDDPQVEFEQDAFGISRIPTPYARGGVRRDRRGPVLVTAMAEVRLPPGPVEWMLRAGGLSRLWIDDEIVAETPPHLRGVGAHNDVEPYVSEDPWLRPPQPGHRERIVTHKTDGGPVLVTLQTIIGGDNLRYEAGEIMVATRDPQDTRWRLLGVTETVPITDDAWRAYADAQAAVVQRVDDAKRRRAASQDDAYWTRRHEAARRYVESLPPIRRPEGSDPGGNPVDAFIEARLAEEGVEPAPLVDDDAFLRRLFLDCLGVPPTPAELDAFAGLDGDRAERRVAAIDRVLQDPRWADHWAAYWMDVLAENPNILKPTLNNTGPFRWYLYDMMRDNVAVDRWVTGLIRMEGSVRGGGPAGFAMAAENDVPMAAKAHILGTAFLGVNMKCARCHDAPYHDWTQDDLFSIAAMLAKAPIEVPTSSSVPGEFFGEDGAGGGAALITLSLKPGDEVDPRWPLEETSWGERVPEEKLDRSALGRDPSSRQRLAYLITRPQNERFARVIVNRLWKRWIGEGLVEPVEDWDWIDPSHPGLLDLLARELTASGYDLKHVARLILRSRLYQREAEDRAVTTRSENRLFAAPRLRRMTAEQVVDSMHTVAGRRMDAGELTFDPEARQRTSAFINLGEPRRAWQLTSLSNERDRPSLTLPRAAAVTECLEAFGWNGARQDPVHERNVEPNVIQPGILAGGTLSIQLTRLTDEDALTRVCLEAESPEGLVDELFRRFLTRKPTNRERAEFVDLVADGFDARVLETPLPPETPIREPAVTWANHLSSEANSIRLRESQRLRQGPPPTRWLEPEWRRRVEDAAWALINTPEFQFVP